MRRLALAQKSRSLASLRMTLLGMTMVGMTMVGMAILPMALVAQRGGPPRPVTIHSTHVLDGRGADLGEATITVENGKITRVDRGAPTAPATYELGSATVMPGLIDAHVHLNWYFNRQGRYHSNTDGDTPAQSLLAMLENGHATLLAGVTTIQSPGAAVDTMLREWYRDGTLPGPRILTSLNAISPQTTTPDSVLRAQVRQRKAQGADLIKVFASASIREGGAPTVTQGQLNAICGEANSLGLRTIVHAHSSESVRMTILAGCTQIEHGVFTTDSDLKLMAERGTYFDPHICLVFQNYLDNRPKYEGIGNFNEVGFASLKNAMPLAMEMYRRAVRTPGVKVVFGTDAVAGAHGNNLDEMTCRVSGGGQSPMDAIVSATSRGAEAIRLGNEIGTLAPGFTADIIAINGDPLKDITAMKKTMFVMRGGRVFRNDKP
jgi:imidazolonepropionase-like amidohydrolase